MKLSNNKTNYINALAADIKGNVIELEGYAAVGRAGQVLRPLTMESTRNIPYGGEIMLLPDRSPVVYNVEENCFEILDQNPYSPGEPIFPVAAFNSPGYVITRVAAYEEMEGAVPLPLFSYGAVGWKQGKFRSAVVRVDAERRQDLRLMNIENVKTGVRAMRKSMPQNRLRKHLERCALEYGCPAGKNFFLGRYEAPLPTSKQCNAGCLGCLSLQEGTDISNTQERIAFTPSPEEIAEVALAHILKVQRPVVSFGQGCEGEPLLAAGVILPAIQRIRTETRRGTINMNTNGSRPDTLEKLFDAGLDSVRISMNSVRKECYDAYFQPRGYSFEDVLKSIELAIRREKFVSINYLNCPGFTDSPEEADALINFLKQYPVSMIQWRNLNFDPIRYYRAMDAVAKQGEPMGIEALISKSKKLFPSVMHGYFNPPREKYSV